MSDLLRGFYTTTAAADDVRVVGGCGHLHRDAAGAVACALQGHGFPVRVARCGRSILPMDGPLDAALEAALRTAEGGGSRDAGGRGR